MQKAFTMAGAGRGASSISLCAYGHAFTMAEILLSLTIIGVVAAITLPSLTGNINERTWNTQRKALYARFSQALALMPSLNGYGTLTAAIEADEEQNIAAKDAVDTAAESFVTEGLSKVLKINNICDHEHLADCGIPDKIITLNGNSKLNLSDISSLRGLNPTFTSEESFPFDINAAAFEIQNGESIMVYYNPNCIGDIQTGFQYVQPRLCANFVYDLNGSKGPNTVGKDIGFITVLYPSDPVTVAPMPLPKDAAYTTHHLAGQKCKEQDSESRVPNTEELISMFYNKNLLGITSGGNAHYWSSEIREDGLAKHILFDYGRLNVFSRDQNFNVRCIKR